MIQQCIILSEVLYAIWQPDQLHLRYFVLGAF